MSSPRPHKKENTRKTFQHPLFGISLKNWISLLEKNGGIDRPFIGRAGFITVTSLGTAPARFLFHLKYEKKINDTKLQYPPVFIIGHWRSGTTFLHELLSQDPQFCHVSLWNTLLPDSFLILEPLKPFLATFLPSKRPMDEIDVDIDGTYEDEAALAVLYPWSFFHCLHFPRNAEEQYLKSIHFQHLTSEELHRWKQIYLNFIKTVTFTNQGKQLLSKNPANTARIPILLELFPEARFIHIYRNPYNVYLSTKKMRKTVLKTFPLQNSSEEEIEHQVIQNYQRMMTSYFEQKKQIPAENLVEIKYEDLIKDPLAQVNHIYEQLKLPGLREALPEIQKYLKKQSEYKTNTYSIDKKIIEHVNNNWRFTIDRWRYTPPK